jgi:hypothetical protein
MTGEWRNKTENPVEEGRSSMVTDGGFRPTHDLRVRQPLMAKEPLCGTQPANLSLVIAVLHFPSCFVIFLHKLIGLTRRFKKKKKK